MVWTRRVVVGSLLVVLCVVAGGLEPVSAVETVADAVAAEAPVGGLPGPLPGPLTVDAPAPIGGELVTDPGEVSLSERELFAREGSRPVMEVVGERSASTETWTTADGGTVLHTYSEPQYFERTKGEGFVPIDNRVVADKRRPGWLSNAGNSWRVWFGPFGVDGGGVEYELGGHVVRIAPREGARVEPEVSDGAGSAKFGAHGNGTQVVYRGVWPGVDVRYSVSNSAIKEELIVTTPEALTRSRYDFDVVGAMVVRSKDRPGWQQFTWDGLDTSAVTWQFPPALVMGPDGVIPPGASRVTLGMENRGEGSTMSLSVDAEWLRAQGGSLPVIIDPTAEAVMQTSSWASYSSDGFSAGTSYGQMVGNFFDYGTGYNRYWRSISSFDLSPIKSANGRVVGAHVDLAPITVNWPASSTTMGIDANRGSSWAYGGAYPGLSFQFPGGPSRQLITDGDGPGGQACYGTNCVYGNGGNLGRVFVGESRRLHGGPQRREHQLGEHQPLRR